MKHRLVEFLVGLALAARGRRWCRGQPAADPRARR
jgi:hypothetical protein